MKSIEKRDCKAGSRDRPLLRLMIPQHSTARYKT